MARASANYTTFYRVVVEYQYDDGSTRNEYFGPYATLGVARSMLNRYEPSPEPDHDSWWARVNASRIESITGDWRPIDAE